MGSKEEWALTMGYLGLRTLHHNKRYTWRSHKDLKLILVVSSESLMKINRIKDIRKHKNLFYAMRKANLTLIEVGADPICRNVMLSSPLIVILLAPTQNSKNNTYAVPRWPPIRMNSTTSSRNVELIVQLVGSLAGLVTTDQNNM